MRALVLCLVVVLPACSTDTFVPGGDAAPPFDAAPLPGEGGGGDAGCASSSYCASHTGLFCSDFDEGTFGSDWIASASPTPAIDISAATDNYKSCPSSMHVAIESNQVVNSYSVFGTGISGVNGVQIDLDAIFPELPAPVDGGPNVDGFLFFAVRAAADQTYYTSVERSADGLWYLRVHSGSTTTTNAPLPFITVGKWNHLTLKVTLSNDPQTGVASLAYVSDQPTTQPATTAPAQTMPSGNTDATFVLGALRLMPTLQHYDVYYDNVLVTALK